jgi:predicted RNA-binding Zn-ribbon protein involved in translation (DUF1610 family)
MPVRMVVWTELKPELVEKFLSYLEQIPEDERPVFGVVGSKSSTWQKLGGGNEHDVVLFFRDRVAFTTLSMVKLKVLNQWERALSDITDVRVVSGPRASSVAFQFSDNSKMKVAKIDNYAAKLLSRYMTDGLSAFDSTLQDPKLVTQFFFACNHGLPLPAELFEKPLADLPIPAVSHVETPNPPGKTGKRMACPHCGEQILSSAIACKHCKKPLTPQ